MTRNVKRFYLGMAVPLVLCALLFGFSALLLTRAGEYLTLDQIIDRQMETKGVYGSSLYQRTFYYKQKLFDRFGPQAVALGSSRVLQFRAEDFNVPFVNLGSMSSIDEASDLARALFDRHKPELVILGLDFWWFLGDGKAAAFTRDPAENHIRPGDLIAPYGWMAQGKLGADDIRLILSEQSPNIGVAGIVNGDGHDRAGAYHYTSIWTGEKPGDAGFKGDLSRIARGEKIYTYGEDIDPAQWQKLNALLDDLAARKINVVLLLPPLAPSVLDAMAQTAKYRYVDRLRLRLSELAASYRFPLFDDHDIRFAGGTDCEFTDGHHGGAIVYKRILLDMAVREPAVRARANLPGIGWAIENYRGRASTLPDETDFLKLGCPKPAGAPAKNM